MKKKIITIFIIQFIIILISVLLIKIFMDIRWKNESDKFNYKSAKETILK